MAELDERTQRYLARDTDGNTLLGGWVEIQHSAQTVFEMCGQQSRLHFHAYGDECNERCDVFPPLPAEPEPAAAVKAEPTVCGHGQSLDRDCGQCSDEARMGQRQLSKPSWGGPNEPEQ